MTSRICGDLFKPGTGLVWSDSEQDYNDRVVILMNEWDTLEMSEKQGLPKFSKYFKAYKMKDIRDKMTKFTVNQLGLGTRPYTQNIPESVNDMLKDWNNFVPQDMDKLIISLYDFAESFNYEEELAWFGISDKWEIREEFKKALKVKQCEVLCLEERKSVLKRGERREERGEKLCPDPQAYAIHLNFLLLFLLPFAHLMQECLALLVTLIY